MKKLLSALIVCALVISCLTVAAFAAGGSVSVANVTAKAGETVSVTVSFSGSAFVAQVPFSFDSSKLTIDESASSGTDWEISSTGAVWMASSGNEEIPGFTLVFTVKSDATGTAAVTLGDVEIVDEDENLLAFACTSGAVTIESDVPEQPVEPETLSVKVAADGKSAQVTGDATGRYVRIALVLDNNGESGLYVTSGTIKDDGSITIPSFEVDGLTVKGVNVALVHSMADITARQMSGLVKGVDFDFVLF